MQDDVEGPSARSAHSAVEEGEGETGLTVEDDCALDGCHPLVPLLERLCSKEDRFVLLEDVIPWVTNEILLHQAFDE